MKKPTRVRIMRLGQTYGQERLEAACRRAQAIHACSYKSLAAILKNKLDQAPLPTAAAATPVLAHPYIRGAHYYH